ncbi:factor H binding protein domain-containing protein [Ursidibacter arcticus]|uniref:factor H binding protein domain-containing protein n=1 Tax=Ursidibacter arcticus TaxID=1524965 RepID=UPI001F08321A|nr:factor H binding protein domain-containing protein [Ursidibacter arcticus]
MTACGSSGGGSNNAKPKTDTQVHTQPQIKQTEIEQLKQQLANAQQAAQQAEEKLKNLSLLSNKEKANLQKELTATKSNLDAITTQLKQANSASTKTVDEIKKTLATTQNNLTNLTQELAKANEVLVQKEKAIQAEQEAKLKAEAALLALNTPLTKEQIYKLAISAGLGNGWADELATDLVGKTKQEVTDEIILASKISKVRTLARNFGYSDQDAKAFEKANRDKSYDDLADLLQKEAEDKQNAREALITELKQLAQSKGLQEWEANNFAYSNVAQGKEVALAELDKLVERNNFIKELKQLAKDKGLEDWEAGNFAYSNADNSKEKALAELAKLATEKEASQKQEKMYQLANTYSQQHFYYNLNTTDFVEQNKDLTLDEFKNKLDQLVTHKQNLETLSKDYLSSWDLENFLRENLYNTLDEAEISLVNRLKELPSETPTGFNRNQNTSSIKEPIVENDKETGRFTTTNQHHDIYNQKYSVVTGKYYSKESENLQYNYDGTNVWYEPVVSKTAETYTVQDDKGLATKELQFPTEGKATYTGVAFDSKGQGTLTYNVDFANRTGEGNIEGLEHIGRLTLTQGEIYKSASTGNMRARGSIIADEWKTIGDIARGSINANEWKNIGDISGHYQLGFYGKNAEEIAGRARLQQSLNGGWSTYEMYYSSPTTFIRDRMLPKDNQNGYSNHQEFDIGFGGTRGEIQK